MTDEMKESTTAGQVYGAYLTGFSGMLSKALEYVSLAAAAAYALGKRDASGTITRSGVQEKVGIEDDAPAVDVTHQGPYLRSCSEVLSAIRGMLPKATSVPVDLDALMHEGQGLAARVGQLTAENAALVKDRDKKAAAYAESLLRSNHAEGGISAIDASVRGIVGGEESKTLDLGSLVELAGAAVEILGKKLECGPTLTAIVDRIEALQAKAAADVAADLAKKPG